MAFPRYFLHTDGSVIEFTKAKQFVYDGVQHSEAAFALWDSEDWQTHCPSWIELSLIDGRPGDNSTKIIEVNPQDKWIINKADKTYTITYKVADKSPEQLGQEQAANDAALMQAVASAVQKHLDRAVAGRKYDSILSACTYATSTVPQYAAEGQACVEWRDAVWYKCYQLLAEVQAGTRARMTPDEVIAELPTFSWPTV